jgi:hypothetical protein
MISDPACSHNSPNPPPLLMDLITGLLAILLEYFTLDRCSCDEQDAPCIYCISSQALDEAKTTLPDRFAAANTCGLAVRRRFHVPPETSSEEPLPTRFLVANVHSADPHYSPEGCDFALVRLSTQLSAVLLAYRDALDGIAAGVRQRFASSASVTHELKLFPPCWVDYLPRRITEARACDGEALAAAVETAVDHDRVVALPGQFNPAQYPVTENAARTDTDHCRVSADGVSFAAYVGETLLFTATIPWHVVDPLRCPATTTWNRE